jgi:hypothetical protein
MVPPEWLPNAPVVARDLRLAASESGYRSKINDFPSPWNNKRPSQGDLQVV